MGREPSRINSRNGRPAANAKNRAQAEPSPSKSEVPERPRRPNVVWLAISIGLFLIWVVLLVLLAVYA
jgi:hypothetical protein